MFHILLYYNRDGLQLLGRIIFLILPGPIKKYFLAGEFGDSKSDLFFPVFFFCACAFILGKQLSLDSYLSPASVGRRICVLPAVHGGFYCARVPSLRRRDFSDLVAAPPSQICHYRSKHEVLASLSLLLPSTLLKLWTSEILSCHWPKFTTTPSTSTPLLLISAACRPRRPSESTTCGSIS